jgi:hypothetical protein
LLKKISAAAAISEDLVDEGGWEGLKDDSPIERLLNMETYLPRRRFLVGTALAACGLVVSRTYGGSKAGLLAPPVILTKEDEAIISELAAYSRDVSVWAGPTNFSRPKLKKDGPVAKSVNFLVRVADFPQLDRYLKSKSLARFGVVYAGGANLAFNVGTTAYTVTNYGPEDFYKAKN